MLAKCDWLSLSYSPEDSPADLIRTSAVAAGAEIASYNDGRKQIISIPGAGTISLESRRSFHYISVSGGVLELYRILGQYENLLAQLASSPHKVTRLDAAYDVYTDAADVLDSLIESTPDGTAALTRKAVKITQFMSVRSDGRRSGTLYYGHRSKARVTARVYDKTLEALEKRKELLPPITRYEITVKDGQATLRDAHDPTALFWHFAAPTLLEPPVPPPPPWNSAGDMLGWEYKPPEVTSMDTAKRHVAKVAPTLLAIADDLGDYGRETVLYLLAKQLGLRLPEPPARVDLPSKSSDVAEAQLLKH